MTANQILICLIGLFFIVTGAMYLSHIKNKEESTQREKSVSYALLISGLIIFSLPFLNMTFETEDAKPIENRKSSLMGEEAFRPDPQMQMKSYEKASKLYEKGAGLWSIELGAFDSASVALSYFDRSIEEYETAEALVGRGQIKVQLSDMESAMADYERAIEIKPEFGNAFFNRAALYYIFGDTQKACEDWNKAKDLGVPQAAEVVGNLCN